MTEMEWRLRRGWPAFRDRVQARCSAAVDYVAAVFWIALCVVLWGLVAMLLWRWFVTVPFGIRPIGMFEALGPAMVTWAVYESVFGPTQHVAVLQLLAQVRALVAVLVLGWVVHFFVPGP